VLIVISFAPDVAVSQKALDLSAFFVSLPCHENQADQSQWSGTSPMIAPLEQHANGSLPISDYEKTPPRVSEAETNGHYLT